MARVVIVAVCLGFSSQADAQFGGQMARTERRGLARACWFGGVSGCFEEVRGNWDRIADTVLAALQAPPRAALQQSGGPQVVWDGTFPHPDAPSFYTLKGLVPAGAGISAGVCGQLPDVFQTDRQLLLMLTCEAERELSAAGPSHWSLERTELQDLRTLLAACLPPAGPNANPCAAP